MFFSFKGSTALRKGSTAFVRTATAPAISYRASYRLPLKDFQWKNVVRRDSQIIGLSPHQGNENVSKKTDSTKHLRISYQFIVYPSYVQPHPENIFIKYNKRKLYTCY